MLGNSVARPLSIHFTAPCTLAVTTTSMPDVALRPLSIVHTTGDLSYPSRLCLGSSRAPPSFRSDSAWPTGPLPCRLCKLTKCNRCSFPDRSSPKSDSIGRDVIVSSMGSGPAGLLPFIRSIRTRSALRASRRANTRSLGSVGPISRGREWNNHENGRVSLKGTLRRLAVDRRRTLYESELHTELRDCDSHWQKWFR
jgi:hypothetical protein